MTKKPDLLLLHGALGDARQMETLAPLLEPYFSLHTYNFPGHGGKAFAEHPLTMRLLTEHLLDHIREFHLIGCTVFGYSMGGYAALQLESEKPGCFQRIFTMGTKFGWRPEVAESEAKLIDPEFLSQKAPNFAAVLQQRHAPNDWKQLAKETGHLMHDLARHPLATDDFGKIECKVRIAIGDRDQMVSFDESRHVYLALPKASFLVMPETPHLFEKINHPLLAEEIRRFAQ